jgi:hypothetical protein
MREFIEFRIPEEEAVRYLEPALGTRLGDSVRKVLLPISDGRVRLIGELDREFRKQGRVFFTYCHISRRYTKKELDSAALLHLLVIPIMTTCGELFGTEYDDSAACPHCGAGAPQKTELHFDLRRISSNKDLAQTLAGEVLVSSRLVEAFREHELTGAAFLPVHHKTGKAQAQWYQLSVTSMPVDIVPPTLVGNTPFDLDERERFRCPQGHLLGLNCLSELWVTQGGYGHEGSDIIRTRQYIGVRQGVLRPEQQLLISPRLYRLLRELEVRRFEVEVAHQV